MNKLFRTLEHGVTTVGALITAAADSYQIERRKEAIEALIIAETDCHALAGQVREAIEKLSEAQEIRSQES